MPRRHKKRRTSEPTTLSQAQAEFEHQRASILSLPIEVFVEILFYCTPRELLALTRSNRALCHTFVAPDNAWIWKRLRCRDINKPPDPPKCMPEPAYAALLYDSGVCEVCKKQLPPYTPLASYTQRLFTCSKDCTQTWARNNVVKTPLNDWEYYVMSQGAIEPAEFQISELWETLDPGRLVPVPFYNCFDFEFESLSPFRHKDHFIIRREALRKQVEYVQNRYKADLGRVKQLRTTDTVDWTRSPRLLDVLSHAESMKAWFKSRHSSFVALAHANDMIARDVLGPRGITHKDILASVPLRRFLELRNFYFERIKESDIGAILPNIEKEIKHRRERKMRQKREESLKQSRRAVADTYWSLRSGRDKQHKENDKNTTDNMKLILPTLRTFRGLPAMNPGTSSQPEPSTQDYVVPSVASSEEISTNLRQWTLRAEAEFAKILGNVADPSEPTSTKPVYWATSWFKCKICAARKVDEREGRRPKPMTFEAACLHECSIRGRKRKVKQNWRADMFTRNDNAISLVRKLLGIFRLNEDDPESLRAFKDPKYSFLCNSCTTSAAMPFETLLGHCQRHEDIDVTVHNSEISGSNLRLPRNEFSVEPGLCDRLLSHDHVAIERRAREIYGCWHCLGNEKASGLLSSDKEVKPRLRSFDGLRCHLKQMHNVLKISDEDVFRIKNHSTGTST